MSSTIANSAKNSGGFTAPNSSSGSSVCTPISLHHQIVTSCSVKTSNQNSNLNNIISINSSSSGNNSSNNNNNRNNTNGPTITTTAGRTSSATVTASAKKTRTKLDHHSFAASANAVTSNGTGSTIDGSNFLPIAPHHQQQTFFSTATAGHHPHHHHQGLTLAPVQQQQLSSGSVVFSSPTMMATLAHAGSQGVVQQPGGPQPGQQLMMTASGQTIGQAFNTANGTPGLIQQAGGTMIGGIQTVQNLQMIPNGGQYTLQPLYANAHGLQPLQILPNLVFPTHPNAPQNLAIQIPQNNTGGMITNQMGAPATTPTTPVKGQGSGQPIIKGLSSISPQQPQATKSSAANANAARAAVNDAANHHQQGGPPQTINIQQGHFQGNPQSQTFVIGTFQGPQTNQQPTTTIMPNTPNNSRKGGSNSRSNSGGNKGANIIQKIQPANTLATSPMIAPAQFKSNTSPFQTTPNGTSPAAGQAIMVHGQGLQSGPGGIQLAPNQTIISPLGAFQTLPPGLAWATTGSPLNQQHIIFQSPRQPNEQPMYIQTSNQQFQALHMPMQTNAQQQAAAQGAMHHTMQQNAGGQQSFVATSISQSLPILQANSTVTSTALMSQHVANTAMGPTITNTNLSTVSASPHSNVAPAAPSTPIVSGAARNRLIRPAGGTPSAAAQSMMGKQKAMSDANRASTMGNNAPKLAPRNAVTTSTGMQVNTLPRIPNQMSMAPAGKLPLPSLPSLPPKPNVDSSQTSKSSPLVTPTSIVNVSVSKPNSTLVSSCTQSSKLPPVTLAKMPTSTTSSTSSMVVATSVTTASTMATTTISTITPLSSTTVSNTVSTNTATNTTTAAPASLVNNNQNTTMQSTMKCSSPAPTVPKINRKIDRNAASMKSMNTSATTTTTNANLANTQMINGVLCHVQTNTPMKSPICTNNNNGMNKPVLPNGGSVGNGVGTVVTKANAAVQKSLAAPPKQSACNKPKQPENLVLTHVIDGYVIQESPNPFPINGFANDSDNIDDRKDSETNTDVAMTKSDTKENIQNSGQGTMTNVSTIGKAANHENGCFAKENIANANQTAKISEIIAKNNGGLGCLECGKKDFAQNGKKKFLKNFCSRSCHESFNQKYPNSRSTLNQQQPQQQAPGGKSGPNGGLPAMVAVPANNTVGHTMPLANVPPTIVIGNLAPSPMNGNTMGGGKRTATANMKDQANSTLAEKRAKLVASPIPPNKSDSSNKSQQNGDNTKEMSAAPGENNNMAELEGLWLPSDGKEPTKWSVQDVYDFIFHLGEGCSEFAENFKKEEIDGQALMLIKEDHIIASLHTKLGPALKISRKIKDLKSAFNI